MWDFADRAQLRTAYKTATYIPSVETDGWPTESSWAFWVCDAAPVLGALVILCVVHPGTYLPRRTVVEMYDEKQIYYDEY